jgi:ribosomal-protein-alanine N-acetyltransferase
VNVATVEHQVRARLGSWPYDPAVAHLVLLDHHMVPDADDVADWIRMANLRGASSLRTGALFPASTQAFEEAGFRLIDTLTLLECNLRVPLPVALSSNRLTHLNKSTKLTKAPLRRLRFADLSDAATVDGSAFDPPWTNDAATLMEICKATPHYRSRSVTVDGRMIAFAISGRTSSSGYIQRIAVDPSAQRRGLGRLLVIDSLEWMLRRKVGRAMVNTAAANHRAIALYRSIGFETRPEPLVILELNIGSRIL